MKTRVAIIGGGAAGLMAAITAAKNGADVCIYEKLDRVGKKILATGNGRCNYTNVNMNIADYHGNNVDFIEEIIGSFNVQSTLDFFEDIGIYPRIEENGKVYPYSLQASSVLDNLRYEVNKYNIKEIVGCNIKDLRKSKGQFDIIADDKIYNADKVIICTGGKAGSQYGCNGDGYKLAENFGHKIINTFPALVQLKLNASYLKRISGVKFEGKVSALTDKMIIREEEGEILFTDYGVSGPPILQISRETIEYLYNNKKVYVSIDMFPDFDKTMLFELLSERFIKLKNKNIEDSFVGLINKKLIPVVLNIALNEYKEEKCTKLSKKDIYSIVNVLKEWEIEAIGHNNWQQAQTTAGGISVDDVDKKTLESKKQAGLYFAGEILDIDGDCGGFNLQWAWSSGYAAGYYASIII